MENNEKKSSFEVLNSINLSDKIKTKMNLSYLSWAYAWGELKKHYPEAQMKTYHDRIEYERTITEKIDENKTIVTVEKGVRELPYFSDDKSCFVKVGVIIDDVEYIEEYPIMDLRNNALSASLVRSTDVNKAIQRAFVKACARHGLGLYIYAGEDIPEAEKNAPIKLSSSDDFTSVKDDVIRLATKLLQTKQKDEAARYIQEVFQGTRLSETTEMHLELLLKARKYLADLDSEISEK